MQGPQDSSFTAIDNGLRQLIGVIKADPAVANVVGLTGGQGPSNGGFIYIALRPLDVRKVGAPVIINRLRPQLNRLPVASLFLQAAQDLRIGGRSSNALYQYTIMQGRALVREARSQYFPAMGTAPAFSRSRSSANLGGAVTNSTGSAPSHPCRLRSPRRLIFGAKCEKPCKSFSTRRSSARKISRMNA